MDWLRNAKHMKEEELVARMREASYYEVKGREATCVLCPHRCVIPDGKKGRCGVREYRDGKLYALTYSLPCALSVDQVEKKPLYHFLPGEKAFSIATQGCNLSCSWCQNHHLSNPRSVISAPYWKVTPEEVVSRCEEESCRMIAFTYTEPTVYYEYMMDVAKRARERGIRTVMVSNGYVEEAPLRALTPYLDAANIDLKSFSEERYKEWTGGSLAPVLRTLTLLKQAKVWLEVTWLVVPGVSDDEEEAEKAFEWLAETLGRDQVLHLSKYFPHHRMHSSPTSDASMRRMQKLANKHLRYVYLGNMGLQQKGVREAGTPGVWE